MEHVVRAPSGPDKWARVRVIETSPSLWNPPVSLLGTRQARWIASAAFLAVHCREAGEASPREPSGHAPMARLASLSTRFRNRLARAPSCRVVERRRVMLRSLGESHGLT
jgi:hypothetical protein